MRTANPALNAKTFTGFAPVADTRTMTIQGTVNKTALLLLLVLFSSSWTWNLYFSTSDPAVVVPWVFGGLISGFIVALVTVFKKQWAVLTAPIYSLLEGLALGGICFSNRCYCPFLRGQFPAWHVRNTGTVHSWKWYHRDRL